jgi:hypothetical protein
MQLLPRSWLRPLAVAALCCASVLAGRAAEKNSSYQAALESIQAGLLGEQVEELADNTMEGRESGTRGGCAAGDYLVEEYTKLHLRGGGDNGRFLQPFAPNFRNVLAILDGSDPRLRAEYIVVGAHYDHVGYGGRGYSLGPYGYIHPGADDNASGTSAVLNLARAFCILATPPKRSILFAAWDAEEKGLLGSKHWVAHPTVPLEHLVAAINLDMIGRLRDDHLLVFGSRSGYGWRRLLSSQNDQSGLQLDFSWSLKPNADHFPFFEHGIPVLMVHTGLHDQYHRPSDVAKLINTAGMTRVARLLFGMIHELADRPAAAPAFRAIARHETPDTEKQLLAQVMKPADRLGVVWVEEAARTGGVRVSGVKPASPAEQAGIRGGDLIVRFAGREIRSDDDFFSAVAAAEPSVTAALKRPSEKATVDVTVHLSGSPLRWGFSWRVDDAEPGTLILTHVVPGSPAARAGLTVGDRVYEAAGRSFADEDVFARLAKALSSPLSLLVERDGRLRAVRLELPRPESAKRAA